jgi:hypothetical protein
MAILLMGFSMWQAGVLGGGWNKRDWGYVKIGEWLTAHGASQAVVMVGDAPAFAWHTGRSAIAIPNEPVEIILAIAERYGARYLVLDGTRTRTTDDLYAGDSTYPKLVLRHSVDSDEETWQLYEVMESPEP